MLHVCSRQVLLATPATSNASCALAVYSKCCSTFGFYMFVLVFHGESPCWRGLRAGGDPGHQAATLDRPTVRFVHVHVPAGISVQRIAAVH